MILCFTADGFGANVSSTSCLRGGAGALSSRHSSFLLCLWSVITRKRKQSTSFAILITRFTGQRAAPAISQTVLSTFILTILARTICVGPGYILGSQAHLGFLRLVIVKDHYSLIFFAMNLSVFYLDKVSQSDISGCMLTRVNCNGMPKCLFA